MSGLSDPSAIDVVAIDGSGECVLVIVEDRPWDADAEQPAQLRAKVNAYAGFILDGELARRYPESAGLPVRIQLDCIEEPSGDILAVVEHAGPQLERLDVGWRVNVRR